MGGLRLWLIFIIIVSHAEGARKRCGFHLVEHAGISLSDVQSAIQLRESNSPLVDRVRQTVQRIGMFHLAINEQIRDAHDNRYSYVLPMGEIEDQEQSGNCWIYAGFNILRSELMQKGKVDASFNFSRNYTYFFSILEKTNTFLEHVIRKRKLPRGKRRWRLELEPTVADGGWWAWFLFLADKYGLAPSEAMPEASASLETDALSFEINQYLGRVVISLDAKYQSLQEGKSSEQDTITELRKIKNLALNGVTEILVTHLGTPPLEGFSFRTQKKSRVQTEKEKRNQRHRGIETEDWELEPPERRDVTITQYTPHDFARRFAGFKKSQYVNVSFNPLRPTESAFVIKDSAIGLSAPGVRSLNRRILNLKLPRILELMKNSLDAGYSIGFATDMSAIDHYSGIMHPEIFLTDPLYQFQKNEIFRPLTRADKQLLSLVQPVHAMTISGYDQPVPSGPILKFRVENSWGWHAGMLGIYHLYLPWTEHSLFQIMIRRSLLSESEREVLRSKATKLSADDWYY